ncbi:type II toxin-antitoxin system RelE/ParE family toxin [Algoriphagus kandeliae]|uniref:Type II toxin-antitoxin system RelE/ParE family toxin n=1 Tax=Algoriphagus kandeliae TaxID=2562278 RepID=A0A4Y9QTY9_9BACT|nr:type II toxin-antitoxin system RelE/ParE family toxin [Algoriphagus kandeliae]TFV95577.1 type II toxin-antitoxin system RelE/ParE family toxin [Algoriphagus kandeliae]
MRIFWSDRSLKDLEEIFQFYAEFAGIEIGQRIVIRIVNKVGILSSNPELGQIQHFESSLNFPYRYLIEGNHKIIYRLDLEKNQILIARVFDTRRDRSMLNL